MNILTLFLIVTVMGGANAIAIPAGTTYCKRDFLGCIYRMGKTKKHPILHSKCYKNMISCIKKYGRVQ
ncbi:hypothetical protein ScPMuIL_017138 [Solemya velum]